MGRVAICNRYVDFLLSTCEQISVTNLSAILEGQYSHDQFSRMLYNGSIDDKAIIYKERSLSKPKEQSVKSS